MGTKSLEQFRGTEWENMSEEDIFTENYKLIHATINKRFPNYKSFCKVHMIDYDDLIQVAGLGLLKAIREFQSDNKSTFQSFAINHISWAISTATKKISLRNINSQTFDVVETVSVETPIDEEDCATLMDVIIATEGTCEQMDYEVMLHQLEEDLKRNFPNNEDLIYIMLEKAKGVSCKEIAEKLNYSHQNAAQKKLKTNKAQQMKEYIKKYFQGEN